MKSTTLIIGIVVALVIGVGAGVGLGMNLNNGGDAAKNLQAAKDMMKEQSAFISTMADTMTANGLTMQVAGTKYNDAGLTSGGKDLTSVAKKYMEEDAKLTAKDSSMK